MTNLLDQFVDTEYLDITIRNWVKNKPNILLYMFPFNSLNINTMHPINQLEKTNLNLLRQD